MKLFLTLLGLFFIVVSPAHAACGVVVNNTCQLPVTGEDLNNFYDCSSGSMGAHKCCQQASECSQITGSATWKSEVTICTQAGELAQQCLACLGDPTNPQGIWTTVGCIPLHYQSMIASIMRFLVSIAGGFALLFILFGAFTISTAAGNPEKLESGKTIITSAIAGLIFLILSVVILHFVGVDLLQIPGFGS